MLYISYIRKENMKSYIYRCIAFFSAFMSIGLFAQDASYSVNVMWINTALDMQQQYLYPAQDKKTFISEFLQHVFRWADVTTNGIVNLWYDSEMTPQKAVENTENILNAEIENHPNSAPIFLQDVRKLPYVSNPEHQKAFDAEIPVYFRVDLLRKIAAYTYILLKKVSSFVYADIDMEPLSQDEIFDAETEKKLDTYGTVLAEDYAHTFENGFFIIRHNISLLTAIRRAIIELNILRAHRARMGLFIGAGRKTIDSLPQVVYGSYPGMLMYLYALEGYGVLMARGDFSVDPPEVYDENKHKLEPFGGHEPICRVYLKSHCQGFPNTMSRLSVTAPTKKVVLPRSQFGI